MRRSREIGWSNAEILLYEAQRAIGCICVPSTTTTTSTTAAPCEGPDCDTALVVGQSGTFYGYASGEFGNLDSACLTMSGLFWDSSTNILALSISTCYTSVIIQIDGREFVPSLVPESGYAWTVSGVTSSPFAPVDHTSTIRICGVPCTTTTTTTLQ